MRVDPVCDMCAEVIDGKVTSHVGVTIRNTSMAPTMNEYYTDMFQRVMGEVVRREEHFDLCGECGMALVIAIKQRQKKIMVLVTQTEEPS